MNARDAILGAVRDGLRGASVPPLPALPALPVSGAPPAPLAADERIARFTAVQQKLGGVVQVVADRRAACARIGLLLAQKGAAVVAASDSPLFAGLGDYVPADVALLPPDAPRERLLQADVGVSPAAARAGRHARRGVRRAAARRRAGRAHDHVRHRPVAHRRHRADAGRRRARTEGAARAAGPRRRLAGQAAARGGGDVPFPRHAAYAGLRGCPCRAAGARWGLPSPPHTA